MAMQGVNLDTTTGDVDVDVDGAADLPWRGEERAWSLKPDHDFSTINKHTRLTMHNSTCNQSIKDSRTI